ncbi:MAG: amidohydrolase family protein [Bacillota bacterium]
MWDLIIRDGVLVTSTGRFRGSLLVQDGKIVSWSTDGFEGVEAREVVDAKGRFILPGMVDAHVHLDEPGPAVNEDFTTGTRAAAAGGVTTVVLMPNFIPCVNDRETLLERKDQFGEKSYVDYAMLGGAGAQMLSTIVPQAEAGAVGYKSYIRPYNPQRPGLICKDSGDVYVTLREVKKSGVRVGFHAEDFPVIEKLTEDLIAQGRTGYADFHDSRPESTEILATLTLLEVARMTGAPLHLVHMSSPDAIELAAQWREWGTDVTIETCPHYLLLSDEDTARVGPYAQVVPPLRSPESVARLWELVEDGTVDIIATDHAPGLPERREKGHTNMFESGGGLSALETVMPLLLTEVAHGRLELERLVELACEMPARLFKMFPRKGTLRPGADADFILFDPEVDWTVDVSTFETADPDAAKIFDGRKIRGRLDEVYVRGQKVAEAGSCVGEGGYGEWITPVH